MWLCAVTAVTAVVPYTPHAANVSKSAWMPAAPPESDPAMLNAATNDVAEELMRWASETWFGWPRRDAGCGGQGKSPQRGAGAPALLHPRGAGNETRA